MSSEPEPGTVTPVPEQGATSVPHPQAEITTTIAVKRIYPESEWTSPEPEAESSAEPIPTDKWDEPFVEPVPDWDLAKGQLGTAWELHVYGIGATFTILAILAFISIILTATIPKLKSRGYFVALNVLLFIFGLVRALYMFVDAYNAKGTLPPVVAYSAINIGYPCLTTMFYILFTALFRLTKFRKMDSRIFTVKYLVGVSTGFFVLQFTTDIVVGFFLEAWMLAFLCEIFFVLWGFVFSVLFLVVFFRLLHATIMKRRLLKAMSGSRGSLGGRTKNVVISTSHLAVPKEHRGSCASISQLGKEKTHKVDPTVQISAVAVLFFIAIGFAHIYGLMSANSLATEEAPDPWPWWSYNFVLRILELCMAFTVLYVATGPMRRRKTLMKKAKASEWTQSVTPSKRTSQTVLCLDNSNMAGGNSAENMVATDAHVPKTDENETLPLENMGSDTHL
ncbi:uncharacterized protein LOC135499593 [Lineus longissimus]|uniref:uncharacterized protein LOC135499593 n=1 Tax=Lineus longissimus TaxID=88925 RepID=UPI00315C7FED